MDYDIFDSNKLWNIQAEKVVNEFDKANKKLADLYDDHDGKFERCCDDYIKALSELFDLTIDSTSSFTADYILWKTLLVMDVNIYHQF